VDWLLAHGDECSDRSGSTRARSHGSLAIAYGNSDAEYVRWCFNVVLGQGFSGAPIGCSSLSMSHQPFWSDVMRIFLQIKFGTQAPALSEAELHSAYNLKCVCAICNLAFGIALLPLLNCTERKRFLCGCCCRSEPT
jgi:hypothetical protein